MYLFIGLFIFARRWNAPRAVHFYIFCLCPRLSSIPSTTAASWTPLTTRFIGSKIVAQLLMPALLLHFALVFPEHTEGASRSVSKLGFVYLPPLAILFCTSARRWAPLGFVPWLGPASFSTKLLTVTSGAACCWPASFSIAIIAALPLVSCGNN